MAVLKHRVLKKKKYIYNNVNFNFLFLYNFNNNVKLIKLINNCYNFLNINKTYFEFFKKTIISVEVKNNYIIKNFKNNINSFLLENKYKNTYNFLLNNYKYCNIYFKQNYNLKKKHIQYFIIKTLLFKFNTNLIKYFITLKFNIIYKLPINNNKFGVLSNNFFIFKRLIKSRLFFIKNIKNIKKYKQLFKLKYRNKITNKINKNKIMKFKSKILKKIFKIFKIFKLSIVFNVNDDLLIYNRKTIKQFYQRASNMK